MARSGEDGAALLLREAASGLAPGTASLAAGLPLTGLASWCRRAGPGVGTPEAGPPDGPFAAILMRWPKAKDEAQMMLSLLAARLAPEGILFLAGLNDDGIKSAPALLETLFTRVDVAKVGHHGRLFAASTLSDPGALRPDLASWARHFEAPLPGGMRRMTDYPGMFSGGRADPGSLLLVEAMASLDRPGGAILDVGCGGGLLSAAAAALWPGRPVTGLDPDMLALKAFANNVPEATARCGTSLADLPPGRFALILSNPPVHDGVRSDLSVLEQLIAGAPARLHPHGALLLVVQHHVPAASLLRGHFGAIRVVAEGPGHRVFEARGRPAASGSGKGPGHGPAKGPAHSRSPQSAGASNPRRGR